MPENYDPVSSSGHKTEFSNRIPYRSSCQPKLTQLKTDHTQRFTIFCTANLTESARKGRAHHIPKVTIPLVPKGHFFGWKHLTLVLDRYTTASLMDTTASKSQPSVVAHLTMLCPNLNCSFLSWVSQPLSLSAAKELGIIIAVLLLYENLCF